MDNPFAKLRSLLNGAEADLNGLFGPAENQAGATRARKHLAALAKEIKQARKDCMTQMYSIRSKRSNSK